MTKFGRFPRLPGKAASPRAPVRSATPAVPEQTVVQDPLLVRFTDALDDEKLAKRLVKLQKEFPQATLPELVTYNWLQREHMRFQFQVELFGGRRVRGGLLPDFVVMMGSRTLAWQVQGEYWHSVGLKGDSDRTANLRMLGQIVNGRRIDGVVELWETDLYQRSKRTTTLRLALSGVGMRE